VVSGSAKADAVAAAIGGADPVDVPSAGAIGREATVWLLDEGRRLQALRGVATSGMVLRALPWRPSARDYGRCAG